MQFVDVSTDFGFGLVWFLLVVYLYIMATRVIILNSETTTIMYSCVFRRKYLVDTYTWYKV